MGKTEGKKTIWKKIAEKLKNSVTTNPILKIFSIIISVILWVVVVNISDPDYIVKIQGIEIQYLNENYFLEQDMVYSVSGSQSETVSVTVKGPRSVLEGLTSKDFVAVVNLKSYDATVNSVSIDISLSSEYSKYQDEIEYISRPYSLLIDLEDITEKSYELAVSVEGADSVAESYVAGSPELSASQITVKAPESVHGKIAKVGVSVDVSGASADVTKTGLVPVLYAADGTVIETGSEITVLSQVDVTVPVLYVKEVSIEVNAPGSSAAGCEVTAVEAEVESVRIYGQESLVAALDTILIDGSEISVDGLSETTSFTVELSKYLPSGVSVYDAAYKTITITVYIESMNIRTITIQPEEINLMIANVQDGYTVNVEDEAVSIAVSGLQADLAVLDTWDISDLMPYVDLNGLGALSAGTRSVLLNVTLPEGVTLTDPVYVLVVIKETETPTEEETPAPTQETTTTSQESPSVTDPAEERTTTTVPEDGEEEQHT